MLFWEEREGEQPRRGWKVKTEAGVIYSVRKRPQKFSTLDKALKWIKEKRFSEIEIQGPEYEGTIKIKS